MQDKKNLQNKFQKTTLETNLGELGFDGKHLTLESLTWAFTTLQGRRAERMTAQLCQAAQFSQLSPQEKPHLAAPVAFFVPWSPSPCLFDRGTAKISSSENP